MRPLLIFICAALGLAEDAPKTEPPKDPLTALRESILTVQRDYAFVALNAKQVIEEAQKAQDERVRIASATVQQAYKTAQDACKAAGLGDFDAQKVSCGPATKKEDPKK